MCDPEEASLNFNFCTGKASKQYSKQIVLGIQGLSSILSTMKILYSLNCFKIYFYMHAFVFLCGCLLWLEGNFLGLELQML